jgi:hypothetical protein
MPMYADSKSKKVKVGPTVEETSVKTVEVSLGSLGTTTTRRNLDQNTKSVIGLENRCWEAQ